MQELFEYTWKKLKNTGEKAMQRAVSKLGKNGDIGNTRDDLVYFTKKTERDKQVEIVV